MERKRKYEAYVDFRNKKKGFRPDRKYFKTYEDAVKWARNEFERFDPDMIGYTEFERPLQDFAKGGEVVEVRYRGLPISESMLRHAVMSEETTDRLEDEFGQDLTFTPIEETKMKPLSYENSRKSILMFDKNFKGLLKGYAKGGTISIEQLDRGIEYDMSNFEHKLLPNRAIRESKKKDSYELYDYNTGEVDYSYRDLDDLLRNTNRLFKRNDSAYAKGGLTPNKAQKMLEDGEANGKPLTDKQKKYFGAVSIKRGRDSSHRRATGRSIYGFERGGGLDDYERPLEDLVKERDKLERKHARGLPPNKAGETQDRIAWIDSIIDERSYAKGGATRERGHWVYKGKYIFKWRGYGEGATTLWNIWNDKYATEEYALDFRTKKHAMEYIDENVKDYAKGGDVSDRWIKTDGTESEGSFVAKADKRNMSVKSLMNKALDYPTEDDFDNKKAYQKYASSKKGKKEIALRKQAQMVKNMGNYAKGGKIWTKGTDNDYTTDIAGIHIDIRPSRIRTGQWFITLSEKGNTFASELVKGLDNAKDQAELMIKEMGIKFTKGGKTKEMRSGKGNDFLKIAADQRKKNIPKPLKNLELNPLNVPFGKVCDIFVGKDELRPVMTYVNYDKPEKTITCTDAHKLLHLTPTPFPKYSGLYHTPTQVAKELKGWEKFNQQQGGDKSKMINLEIEKEKLEASLKAGEVGAKYPNYKQVIHYQDAIKVQNIDTAKLFWYASVLNKAKEISPFGGTKISYINNITKQIVLRYKSTNLAAEKDIIYLGVNAFFLETCLKGMMMLGEKNSCDFYNQSFNRPMIFDYEEQGKFNLANFNGFLLMPVMLSADNPTDIGNYDFDISLDLVYDLDENAIYSNGELYEINEELGYKAPKKLSSDTKKVVVKDKKSEKSDNLADYIGALERLIKIKPKEKVLKEKLKTLKKLQAFQKNN